MTSDEVFETTISPEQAGQRIDRLATELLTGVTRGTVQRWIAERRVLVDGVAVRARDKAREGALLRVSPGREPATNAQPDASVPVDVRYEDEQLLVVHKPAGMVVHPSRGHRSGTLVNGLLARPGFERPPSDPLDPEGHFRPGIVHRIDKDTSGLLVVAKTSQAREGLKAQLAAHDVQRLYVALTVGVPPSSKIETLHGRDPRSRLRFSCRVSEGKRAVTHVQLVQSLAQERAALVSCRLETGRTHQIRVHLSGHAKTPLLADQLYGGMSGPVDVLAVAQRLGRQALHAKSLGFVHPATGKTLEFEAEIPPDMETALSELRTLSQR